MMLALRLARRELRGGVRGLWIVLLCLALGVAVIAAVGTLREAHRPRPGGGRPRLLGGDLEVESGAQPLPDTLRDWLRHRGATLSDVVPMRSMLVAASGERQLVELKAVDAAWPLVGAPVLDPPQPSADALGQRDGRYGLLADQVVLDRLGLHAGDTVRLGTASFPSAARCERSPTASPPRRCSAPRVLIAHDALPATGLIAPGAMVRYALRADRAGHRRGHRP